MATDHEFQVQVTDTLARLETKVDIIVGPDGTGGWKAETNRRIDRLESTSARDRGFRQGRAGLIGGLIGAGLPRLLQLVFSHFGR